MRNKSFIGLLILATALFLTVGSFAQESTVKGNLAGVVADTTGAVVPAAKVTISGATGNKTVDTDSEGKFYFPLVVPGYYTVKVEKTGFKTTNVQKVEVLTGRTAQVSVSLPAGAAGETVEVTADATTVDTTSTAVGANLSDSFYSEVPINRNVASLFRTAPGVVSGGGTGNANPSIGGASGLENMYVADGVNITDSAFGGLGVFTRAQGSIGSGINLSFIKEVDVKTGGFEPQYGQATGGIVQMITKSGSDHYHGAVAAYFAPSNFQATPKFRDDFRINQIGKAQGTSTYEASGELGGYVPHFRDHLFFFGSFDPTWNTNFVTPPVGSGLAAFGTQNQHTNTYNYAAKMTFKLTNNHQVEISSFGDPSHTGTAQLNGTLNRLNQTGYSKWNYGTKNTVARYNGTLSTTWLVDGAFRWNNNEFTETPLQNVFNVTDSTSGKSIVLGGFGFLENHRSNTFSFNGDTSKVFKLWGDHTISVGYNWENPNYDDIKGRSGGTYTVPAANATGGAYLPTGGISPAGRKADAQFTVLNATASRLPTGATCTLCPIRNGVPIFVRVSRGEFGESGLVPTDGKYMDGYINDNYVINRKLSLSIGLRWEQQRITGTGVNYVFNDNWSPRMGFSYDPFGTRKTKIYGNFGRYHYPLPLDAAIRSLSTELDLTNVDFAPVLGANGSLTVVPDQAHLISGAVGGTSNKTSVFTAGFDPTSTSPYFIVPGTRMTMEDEFIIGGEREWKGIVFSARYVDRRLNRIVEDMGGVSPEASLVLAQISVLGNPSPKLDTFVNEKQKVVPAGTVSIPAPAGSPAGTPGTFAGFPGCNTSNTLGFNPASSATPTAGSVGSSSDALGNVFSPNGICFLSPKAGFNGGEVGADGISDGFVNPIRHYSAVEFEANKSFSHNYLLRVNYRVAELRGNYEGAFRNDNGQTDPGISSLFDFTTGQYNLLGNQFTPGYLPTDRRHVLNTYFAYTVPELQNAKYLKGLTIGTAIRAQSGTPITQYGNHPAYGNPGEVPVGGRGSLGRTPAYGTVDLKLDKPWRVGERYTVHFTTDMFNLFNNKSVTLVDGNNALNLSPVGSNLDFQKPLSFQSPFFARMALRLEF